VDSSLSAELANEQCFVCLQIFPIGGLACIRDENDRLVGGICPKCFNLGKRKTLTRLRIRSTNLHRSTTDPSVFIPIKDMTESEWADYLLKGLSSLKGWPSRQDRSELMKRLRILRVTERLLQ